MLLSLQGAEPAPRATQATPPPRAETEVRVDRREVEAIKDQIRAALDAVRESRAETRPPPFFPPEGIPTQAVDIAMGFFFTIATIAIGFPLARAFARRMDRRSQGGVEAASLAPRFDRMEQAIEAVAIEVERISENQRYTTRILSELRALPAANALDGWPAAASQRAEPVAHQSEPRRP